MYGSMMFEWLPDINIKEESDIEKIEEKTLKNAY